MRIALLQADIIWENTAENLQLLSDKINNITQPVDLIVLPEMFTSGFTMNPDRVAQPMNGSAIQWLKNTAQIKNVAIVGSLVIEEDNNYYNRLIFVFPNGAIQHYDKRHLFTLTGEEKVYTPTTANKLVVEYKGWKICPLICYDLRFPVYSRNVEMYDLLLYVANWPQPRINAWDILLKARAVENIACVVGVNRVGADENNMNYVGHSQAIDELGNYVIPPYTEPIISYITFDKTKLEATRNKLNFLNDKDQFTLHL